MDKAFASVALKNAAAFGRIRDGIARVVEKLHRAGFRRSEVDRAAFARGLQFHDVALERIKAREEFALLLREIDEALILVERDFDGLAFAAHREAGAVVVTRPLERRFLVDDGRAAGKHERGGDGDRKRLLHDESPLLGTNGNNGILRFEAENVLKVQAAPPNKKRAALLAEDDPCLCFLMRAGALGEPSRHAFGCRTDYLT